MRGLLCVARPGRAESSAVQWSRVANKRQLAAGAKQNVSGFPRPGKQVGAPQGSEGRGNSRTQVPAAGTPLWATSVQCSCWSNMHVRLRARQHEPNWHTDKSQQRSQYGGFGPL